MKQQNKIYSFLKIALIVILFGAMFFCLGVTSFGEEEEVTEENSYAYLQNTLNNDGNLKYTEFLANLKQLIVKDYYQEIAYSSYFDAASPILPATEKYGYLDEAILLNADDKYRFTVMVPSEGLYVLGFDYYLFGESIIDAECQIVINSDIQYYETRQLMFGCEWESDQEFGVDRYGNEILPSSTRARKWYTNQPLVDGSSLHDSPLYIYLKAGLNEINMTLKSGSVLIGKLYLQSKKELISYQDYLDIHKDVPYYDGNIIKKGAEIIDSKSSLDIRIYALQNSNTSRYHTKYKLLNAVYEQSWDNGNQAITWTLDAPQSGLYALSFKYLQDAYLNMPVHRTIMINGEVPFKDLYAYPFYYTKHWKNETLHNQNGTLYVYLNEGANTLTMKVNMDVYRYAIEAIDRIMDEMSELSLEIKSLTNGQKDTYRNWNISKYIPNLKEELNRWCDEINELRDYLKGFSANGKESTTFSSLKVAIKKLQTLAKDPDQIANNLTLFTDGSASVSQVLGNLLLTFNNNPLGLEQIYLANNNAKLPKARENFFVRFFEGVKRFFISFFTKEYATNTASDEEIEVWVNLSRQYVEVMQQLADKAGKKVKFSLMPDEKKLILANSSGSLPDAALGLSNWIPYDLALRGITQDLRGFDGYEEVVSHFAPGMLIPYAFDDGMYGLPETLDFWVTFYRSDIYASLNLEVPSTWDDLVGQLPILQRLGYNFYSPLSSYRGLKPYVVTLPFFYQWSASGKYSNEFTGSLYAYDGMTTTLSGESYIEAMKFMTNLFMIYDVPEETLSFYNSFRYGTLPIGIANRGTYTSLLIAAPEINGNWSIAPHIGYDNGSEVIRYATSASQGLAMFSTSNKKAQTWDFIKWWLSTATQEQFVQRMYSMYGLEYTWYTANLDAFKTLPIDAKHKNVILDQVSNWSMEASRVPAAYMIERSISDAYSKIVFNGTNVRIALDDAVIESNREIERKMTEFKYMENGKKTKDYKVPSIYNIQDWLIGRKEE